MDRILDSVVADHGVYRCAECGYELGPRTGNYRVRAAHFDASISTGEPAELASFSEDEYLLRHYFCPGCATLFEVEMVPVGASGRESVRLSPTAEGA
jgi:acetone carboxylase gamma subunit